MNRKEIKVCARCKTPWRTRKGKFVEPKHGSGSPKCSCTWNGKRIWEPKLLD